MTFRFPVLPLVFFAWTLQSTAPALAQGCFVASGKTETLSVALAGDTSAELQVSYYEELAEIEDEIICQAWISVPLSAFPTWRLATRPADVAPLIRDVADRWGARECAIAVWLQNDTGDDLAEGDECMAGLFRYESGDWWASSAEWRCDAMEM